MLQVGEGPSSDEYHSTTNDSHAIAYDAAVSSSNINVRKKHYSYTRDYSMYQESKPVHRGDDEQTIHHLHYMLSKESPQQQTSSLSFSHESSPLRATTSSDAQAQPTNLPATHKRGGRMCPYCSYETYIKSNLDKHIKTHSGERPFACPYCSFRAIQRTNLMSHMRRHTGEKPFACKYCSYQTTRNSTLKEHVRSKHSSVMLNSSN